MRVQGYAPPAFRAVRGYEGGSMDTVKALRTQVKALLAKLRENVFVCSQAEFEADRAAAAPHVRALLGAAELFEQVFTEKKLAEKKLEYSDFRNTLPCTFCAGKTAKRRPPQKRFHAALRPCLWMNTRIPTPCRPSCTSALQTRTARTCF